MTVTTYNESVRRNSRRIYLLALAVTRRQQDAEDVMQNVFLKLWQHSGRFTDEEHIDRWLTRVCVNECRSLLRRGWQKHVSLDEIGELAAMADAEQDQALVAAVLRLPEKYRMVIHLFYFEELSVQQIASLLHLTQAAVRQRLHRGREQLRSALSEEYTSLSEGGVTRSVTEGVASLSEGRDVRRMPSARSEAEGEIT